MGRALRTENEGGWHFITARANPGLNLFRDMEDFSHLVSNLSQWNDRHRVRLAAFVLLHDHYHLLAHFPGYNLSRAMQWLNVSYGHWHQHRHHFKGHLFAGRFESIPLCEQSPGPALASHYIHLHPIRNHLGISGDTPLWLPPQRCACFRRATSLLLQHRWNSAPDWLGQPRPWISPLPLDAYPDRLKERHQQGIKPGPKSLKAYQPKQPPSTPADPNDPATARAIVEKIKSQIARERGQPWDTFAHKHGDKSRDQALAQAHALGLTANTLAFLFEMTPSAVRKAVVRIGNHG